MFGEVDDVYRVGNESSVFVVDDDDVIIWCDEVVFWVAIFVEDVGECGELCEEWRDAFLYSYEKFWWQW